MWNLSGEHLWTVEAHSDQGVLLYPDVWKCCAVCGSWQCCVGRGQGNALHRVVQCAVGRAVQCGVLLHRVCYNALYDTAPCCRFLSVKALHVSPNNLIASGSNDRTLKFWDVSGELKEEIDVGSPVNTLSFCPGLSPAL